jgi:hypothetical protein
MAIATVPLDVPYDVMAGDSNFTPFCVSASSADVTGCEVIKAAPGATKQIVLKKISIYTVVKDITWTIGPADEGDTAVESIIIGPIESPVEITAAGYNVGSHFVYEFTNAVYLPANKALCIDGDAGQIHIIAEGFVTV